MFFLPSSKRKIQLTQLLRSLKNAPRGKGLVRALAFLDYTAGYTVDGDVAPLVEVTYTYNVSDKSPRFLDRYILGEDFITS